VTTSLKPLVAAIAGFAAFLEFSDDATVDPDAAVAQLESLAFHLQALQGKDRDLVVNEFRRLSSTVEDERLSEFFATLPEALGLE